MIPPDSERTPALLALVNKYDRKYCAGDQPLVIIDIREIARTIRVGRDYAI
jgi:hypothetical protein